MRYMTITTVNRLKNQYGEIQIRGRANTDLLEDRGGIGCLGRKWIAGMLRLPN